MAKKLLKAFEHVKVLGLCMLLVLGMLVLGACSTGRYVAPIKKFAATTTAMRKVIENYNTSIHTTILEERIERAIEKQNSVIKQKGSCSIGSKKCILEFQEKSLVPVFPLQNSLVLMTEIEKYSQNLQAIAEADVETKVDAAIAKIQGALKNLNTSLNNGNQDSAKQKNIDKIAQASGSIVKWVAGAYLDSLKLDALQRATDEADPLVQQAAGIFKEQIKEAKNINIWYEIGEAKIFDTWDKLETKFEDTPTKQTLRRWLALSQAFDSYLKQQPTDLKQQPTEIFDEFAESHRALTKALNGDLSFVDAWQSIDRVQESVEKLRKAISSLQRALQEG